MLPEETAIVLVPGHQKCVCVCVCVCVWSLEARQNQIAD
jgi:hypothetical protein